MHLPFYKTNRILSLYLEQDKRISPFFKQPLEPDWAALCHDVRKAFHANGIIEELIHQNRPAGDAATEENLKKLANPNSTIVITGQQLGLMVSPLYTVYKILTALKRAEVLDRQLDDFHVVPVFWLEGEDHDFAEINHMHYWNHAGEVRTAMHPEDEGDHNRSISKRHYSGHMKTILSELERELPESEYKAPFLKTLQGVYKPGREWTGAFREHLLSLFQGTGLLTFNPADPGIKQRSRPFFKKMIEQNHEVLRQIKKVSRGLIEKDLFNQVTLLEDRSYLFFNDGGSNRQPLLLDGDRYGLREPERTYTADDLTDILEAHPDWFSSSVLSRPLWQSWMLPVISYVAGPGEIAYWAQIGGAFSAMGLIMPHLQPRMTLTLIEPRTDRLMRKYGIGPEDLTGTREQFVRKHIASTLFKETDSDFMALQEKLAIYKKQLQGKASEIDPTLEPVVTKSFGAIDKNLGKLRNRLLKRLEEKEDLVKKHLEFIYDAFLPAGSLQERYIGSVYFQNKYGPHWIQRLSESVDINNDTHQLILI